jgi:hypothetical protein
MLLTVGSMNNHYSGIVLIDLSNRGLPANGPIRRVAFSMRLRFLTIRGAGQKRDSQFWYSHGNYLGAGESNARFLRDAALESCSVAFDEPSHVVGDRKNVIDCQP